MLESRDITLPVVRTQSTRHYTTSRTPQQEVVLGEQKKKKEVAGGFTNS